MAWGRVFARRRRGGLGIGGALAGLAAGAGLAYFLDPVRGARRRARALDRTRRAAHDAERTAESRARDLSQRARGAAHEARARIAHERVPDEVLVERVRARLGRLVAHPHAIEVAARDGHVELSGAVFRAEQARLLRGVRAVRGVRRVEDRLQPHDHAEGVPELRGGGPLEARLRAARWPAGATAVAVAIGSVSAARALLGRRLLGIPAALAGAALARGAIRGSRSRSARDSRHAAREASREAGRRSEQERDRAAHEGAWHPEPEVREVKSPAELEPGIAHASPEPTFPSRVSPRGGRSTRSRPGGGGATPPRREKASRAPGAAGDPSLTEPAPRSGFVSPLPGAAVRGDDLGMVPGPDEPGPAEQPDEGGPAEGDGR